MAKYDDTARILGLPEDATYMRCVEEMLEGMTQADFCRKYRIPRRTLQNWKLGVKPPTEYTLYLLARAVVADKGRNHD